LKLKKPLELSLLGKCIKKTKKPKKTKNPKKNQKTKKNQKNQKKQKKQKTKKNQKPSGLGFCLNPGFFHPCLQAIKTTSVRGWRTAVIDITCSVSCKSLQAPALKR
jgi:hypothetical protein